jgi:ammonia channel protein AmtB
MQNQTSLRSMINFAETISHRTIVIIFLSRTLGKPIPMPGHSTPLAGLGGLIIVFGFLAFNGGSQALISAASAPPIN